MLITITYAVVWWFAVVSSTGGVTYYNYGDQKTCEMLQKAKSKEVESNKITNCMSWHPKNNERDGWTS